MPREGACRHRSQPLLASGVALLLAVGFATSARAEARSANQQRQVAILIAGKRIVRPKALNLMGLVIDGVARHLVWSSWGPTDAIGKGTRTAEPTGTGTAKYAFTVPTTITLYNPVSTSDGWLFDQLTYEDKASGNKPVAPDTFFGGPDVGLSGSWPRSLIIFPTADNVTGNYLWASSVGVSSQDDVLWLQLVQDGETVSGTIEDDEQQPSRSNEYGVSGITSDGTVSVTITGDQANDIFGVSTLAFRFSAGDLSPVGTKPMILVPASWATYLNQCQQVMR